MHLTPEIAERCYEFLRSTPPFNSWRLPDAGEVEFRIMRDKRYFGQHWIYVDGSPGIDLSIGSVSHTSTLVEVMSHELVHVRQGMLGYRDIHGRSFARLAASVCRHHGFDPRKFY